MSDATPDSAFRPDPDAEWAEVLRQLRQPPATQPGPFFYAQVQARLLAVHRPARAGLPRWARRTAYALGLAVLVAALSGDAAATVSPSSLRNSPQQSR